MKVAGTTMLATAIAGIRQAAVIPVEMVLALVETVE
jgi:hypothetical protein